MYKSMFCWALGHPLFFLRLLSNAFSDHFLGRSVGEKKNRKNKVGKGVWREEALHLSIKSQDSENNNVWLQSQLTWRQWRKKKIDVIVRIKGKQGRKLKIRKAKQYLRLRLK